MPTGPTSDAIIGREDELRAISDLLDRGPDGLSALVLEGEPGMGKTTLWREGVSTAAQRGMTVLTCRPAEAERRLSFAALIDLLHPVSDPVLESLPAPQRTALEIALLRRSPEGAGAVGRAIGTALATVLERIARAERRLLIAIDDVQWLDAASRDALAFALRRVPALPISVLLGHRVEGASVPDVLGLARELPDAVERRRLKPMHLGALYHLLSGRLGVVHSRPVLQRIEDASGGNPLYALEIARALQDAGSPPQPGQPLPVPAGLTTLLAERVARLSRRTQQALLAAALAGEPTLERLDSLVGHATDALKPAQRAGLVEVRDGYLRFSHPLFAATVAAAAGDDERRAMHRRLSAIVEGDEQQARHLALATVEPDDAVAHRLEGAASTAAVRGATESAAELLELAVRLTPPADTAATTRRRLALAEVVFRAGDARRAQEEVTLLLGEVEAGPMRARGLELLARLLHVAGAGGDAVKAADAALDQAGDDWPLLARIRTTRALVEYNDVRAAHGHARRALDILGTLPEPDPGLEAQAILAFAQAEIDLGHPIPNDLVERGLALEQEAPAPSVADRLSAAIGAWYKYAGRFDDARRWLEHTHRAAVEEGDEGSLPYALSHLPQLELWTGRWEAAERWARRHLELSERTHQPSQRLQAIFNLALVRAHLGEADEALALVEDAMSDARTLGEGWAIMPLSSVAGFAHLSLGNADLAVHHLAITSRMHAESGTLSPPRAGEDYAEALVLSGDLDRADRMARLVEERSRAIDQSMTLAPALRNRALVAGARGDLDEAVTLLDAAREEHARCEVPFSLARTYLAEGQLRRRRGERRAARDALEQAISRFEALGARLWAVRARAELARLPIRKAAGEQLTPTEERVAALVAEGLTNAEIGRRLFISPKTVEANLSRVYGKLGLRSRTELAARMTAGTMADESPKA